MTGRPMSGPQINLHINLDRLMRDISDLAKVDAIEGGGVSRLELNEEDRRGRNLVVSLLRHHRMEVSIDQIGNVLRVREGTEPGRPVVTGSHIDTVRTGGRYDGSPSVLTSLEAVATLTEVGMRTWHLLAVGFFYQRERRPLRTGLDGQHGAPGTLGAGRDARYVRSGYHHPARKSGEHRLRGPGALRLSKGPILC